MVNKLVCILGLLACLECQADIGQYAPELDSEYITKIESYLHLAKEESAPILGAINGAINSNSPEEREYMIRFLRYKAKKSGLVAQQGLFYITKQLEKGTQTPQFKNAVAKLLVRYPQSRAYTELLRTKLADTNRNFSENPSINDK